MLLIVMGVKHSIPSSSHFSPTDDLVTFFPLPLDLSGRVIHKDISILFDSAWSIGTEKLPEPIKTILIQEGSPDTEPLQQDAQTRCYLFCPGRQWFLIPSEHGHIREQ